MAVRGFILRLWWVLFAVTVPVSVLAQPAESGGVDVSVPSLPEGADVRIVVDISGSMKTSDPDNLRQPAVRLLARMLPETASAGVWTFGEYVNNLVAHGSVTEDWRELAISQSGAINSVALRTNLGGALERAATDYNDGDLSSTHFIVLTDGKVDIAENDQPANARERSRILEELLPQLKDAGATIHTVALSNEADLELLERMASETRGRSAVAETADELSRAFLKALNAAAPQVQVPLDGNGFRIDAGVNEFTALIFNPAGDRRTRSLVTPEGNRVDPDELPDNVRWAPEPDYDLITVNSPAAGQWMLESEPGEGSQVTVVSDLQLVVEPLPSSFERGEAVDVLAAFYEEDVLLTDPEFLRVIEVTLKISDEQGRSGEKVLSPESPPEDGVYRDVIQRLQEPGDYALELTADGRTFTRQFSYTLTLQVPEDGDNTGAADIPLIHDDSEIGTLPGNNEPAGSDSPPEPESPAESVIKSETESRSENGAQSDGNTDAGAGQSEPDETMTAEAEESDPESGTPWLLPVLAAGSAVGVAGAGVLFWRRRRSSDADTTASDTPLADGLEDEKDDAEPPLVPVTEPEPEAQEAPTEPPDEQRSGDEEADEFGLEDFDLSDVDELPEDDLDTDSDLRPTTPDEDDPPASDPPRRGQ